MNVNVVKCSHKKHSEQHRLQTPISEETGWDSESIWMLRRKKFTVHAGHQTQIPWWM